MSVLAERLRGIVRPAREIPPPGGRPPAAETAPVADPARRADPAAVAEALGGEWHEAAGHRVLVVERVYRPGHRHGDVVVADALPPADTGWPGLALLAGTANGQRASDGRGLLFLDLETTGLAGGAGTCVFLVGCGWFDGGVLRVRQLFLPGPAAERALLGLLADLAAAAGTLVTYNGKSFDVPLIETRFLYHRLETPFAGVPHVDLLPPARRLWRPEPETDQERDAAFEPESGCRLVTLERMLCGMIREGDVPGFEIPARYFTYVRTGNPRPLAAVLEHNRLDLVSLALLTARAAHLLGTGAAGARTPREAFGLGRIYERAGRLEDALACYGRAADAASPEAAAAGLPRERARAGTAAAHVAARHSPVASLVRIEAVRACAVVCRRMRRYDEAAAAWRRLLDVGNCPPQFAREAAQALAVHHEHRLRDPHTARALAVRALSAASGSSWRVAVQHRLARLDRKLRAASATREPMF